jgi:CubicO group peptidase (beta-lactamase class C family)
MQTARPTILPVALAVAISLSACADDDPARSAVAPASTAATTTGLEPAGAAGNAPVTTGPPPTTEPADTESPSPSGTTPPGNRLVEELQRILDGALETDAIAWNAAGADAPPTGASLAVRVPGRDDVVLASGESVDGTPYDAEAPFNAGPLTESLVQTVAYQLVDEGTLDPNATVDQWLPAQPNANRITVQMLLDSTHGWGAFGEIPASAIPADLTRRWTLTEVLATLESNPPVAEPGTFSTEGGDTAVTALALIAELVTGKTMAELVEARIAQPAGLDDTAISDGAEPADFENGIFTFNGQRADTSTFPHTSYNTYNTAYASANSTLRDLLDLLDVWRRGELFTTERVPGPDHFLSKRMISTEAVPTGFTVGYGIPFNGYCPCRPDGAGMSVTAIGRAPASLGTDVHLFHYPADEVSVVLHFNSSEWVDRAPIRQIVDAIHDAAIRP